MSHNIQNEIIQIIANQITCDKRANIRNNFFQEQYSVICDKHTDISNCREKLLFCIHCVNGFLVTHKEFLEFFKIPNTKSETCIKIVKYILLPFQLSLQ